MFLKEYFKKHGALIVLLFCILVSLLFRMYDLNWDHGLLFHPDERNIANAVTRIHFFTQLNPHFFAYGGFAIYLYRATGDFLVFLTNNPSWVQNWGFINLIGRFYSALFSVFTIIPLYFVGKKLFNRNVGLLSSLLYTFTVTSIQNAHYAVTDSSLAFFAILLCLLSLLWIEKPSFIKTFLFALTFGISVADKTSALSFIIFPILSLLLYVLSRKKRLQALARVTKDIIVFAVTSSLVFMILSPYSILDFHDFYASMQYESAVATGSLPVVYTLQFVGSIPYLFQIQNFTWQLGPLLTIVALLGMVLIMFESLLQKEKKLLPFLAFPLLYFLYVGSWHTKFLRYMLPIIPFLLIAGSFFLLRIQDKFSKTGKIFILLTLTGTALWAGAFMSIYLHPQTRIAASVYIYQHVPPGSTILTEQWDDMLPMPLDGDSPALYHMVQLNMYAQDNKGKVTYLSSNLSRANYIAIDSRRLYGTLMRLTTLYPMTSKYYKLLFAGKLGYKKIGMWSDYPQLFGITINDDSSEETFQVFDHPKVFLFENTNHYSVAKLESILQ